MPDRASTGFWQWAVRQAGCQSLRIVQQLENHVISGKSRHIGKVVSYRENHVISGKLVFQNTDLDGMFKTCRGKFPISEFPLADHVTRTAITTGGSRSIAILNNEE